MLISELEDLEDILDTLIFEDPPTIFDEEYALELIETALQLMEDYTIENPTAITEPNFRETLLEEIKDLFYVQIEDMIIKDDYVEDDLDDLLEVSLNIYISTFHPERSIDQEDNELCTSDEDNDDNHFKDLLEQKIKMLSEIPQPVQRTEEWYKFRWNLITASNAWKAFESQPTINQLIYEKCQPLKTDMNEECTESIKIVNTNTPLHWGQKYEPLSVLLYEKKYDTKVGDFGCIPHSTYKFIGASPDGINIDKKSDRYGRMLEIKNVVSREINGIPKKEYWIQMQLQMEVCDLDECDFLETKFTEYTDFDAYKNDVLTDGKMKGIIIHFHKKDGSPFYAYKPLDITSEEDIEKWENETLDLYQTDPSYNYVYLKFIYWKLERFSCVLVLRNKEWFKNNIPQLEKVWKIIEEERVSGYEHRAPNKKLKKEPTRPYVNFNNQQESSSSGCLLKFNKIIKIDTEVTEPDS
jgi:putative phage-type endonuclease